MGRERVFEESVDLPRFPQILAFFDSKSAVFHSTTRELLVLDALPTSMLASTSVLKKVDLSNDASARIIIPKGED
jgi:hypothetical protein